MLWVPLLKKTRSGTEFSPFGFVSALRAQDFDFAPLLAAASAEEHVDDHEEQDDSETIDEEWPAPPPTPARNPLEEIDDFELSAPLPPKRSRTAFDEMQEGKKPAPSISRSHQHRKRKRLEKAQKDGQKPSTSTIRTYVAPSAPIRTELKTESLPVAHGGYAAKAEDSWGSKKRRSLTEFLGMGFSIIPWNGFDPRPIVDSHGRIFAVLAGQPRDPTYAASVSAAYHAITEAGIAANFASDMRKHRRGLFAAVNVGLSYSKGQTVPSCLHHRLHGEMAQALLANEHVQRMATFASAAFALWAPRLYEYYRRYDAALHRRLRQLGRIFDKSVFSCAAFNFGPSVWTFRHRDILNVPFGWCAIQAAGDFDPTKGGHLVLWELKLVIEFPPGALILVPSATITHSNVPVQDGDSRISFTQYTPGGLIRYVDNGFRTESILEQEDPEEFERLAALKDTRWEMGLGLLSTLDELIDSE